jgi:proteasome activator subunit 4
LEFYPKLVSYTLQVSESAQADVQEMANAIIKIFPKYVLPKDKVSTMIAQFCEYGTQDVSWHIKIKIINIIQVFYYYHIQFLSISDEKLILESLLNSVEDLHLEVRKAASETLAGILRCSQRNEIIRLKVLKVEFRKHISAY